MLEQHAHDIQAVVLGRSVDRRFTAASCTVSVCAVLEQGSHDIEAVVPCGAVVQCSSAILVGCVDRRTSSKQETHDREVPLL